MELHRGRLIDHLHLKVRDLDRSLRFYKAVVEVLGIPLVEGGDHFYVDELWVDVGETPSRVHFAFQAADHGAVDRFHAVALAAGGRDNGPPGPRPYHPDYYAAFVLDPDGNNVEAVHHGPARRSAPSVVVAWD